MPYKVIKTIENSDVLYTEVPASWEKDGVLYWPVADTTATSKVFLNKCLKEETVPTPSWYLSECVVKGTFINLQSAKAAAKNLCQLCTEDEERYEKNATKPKFRMAKEKSKKKDNKDDFFHKKLKLQESVQQNSQDQDETQQQQQHHEIQIHEQELIETVVQQKQMQPSEQQQIIAQQQLLEQHQIIAQQQLHEQQQIIAQQQLHEQQQIISQQQLQEQQQIIAQQQLHEQQQIISQQQLHEQQQIISQQQLHEPQKMLTEAQNQPFQIYGQDIVLYEDDEDQQSLAPHEESIEINEINHYNEMVKEIQRLRDTIETHSTETTSTLNNLVSIVNGLAVQNDEIFKLLKQSKITDELPLSELDLKQLDCPLSTVEAVEHFEERLNDKTLFKEIVNKLSEIGGRTGKLDIKEISNIGLKVAAQIFSHEVLVHFTWTGRTKNKKTDDAAGSAKKHNFIKFTKIISLFYQVLNLSCKEMSMAQTENFIQYNLLKHALLRLARAQNKNIANVNTETN